MPRGFIKYTTYSFVEKDPIIDVLRTVKADGEHTNADLSHASKVSRSTLNNWFKGKTRRPQFATVAAVAVAMGVSNLPITPEGRRKLRNK